MANFLKNLFDKKGKAEKVDVARRFELLARVGQGSMSKVWRARDAMTGKMLAVKVLDKLKTERFEARFVGLKKPSEGDISLSLQHRNIVKTLESGITTTDEQYLIMEFVEGVSLSYLVDLQNEQMKENRLSYVIQLGEAIGYLHKQNWIHRDLCPRNVMVDQDNIIKLIDFGLVVPNTPDFQKPGNRTGTASYMAPELIKRQRTDQRIDIYSYAVTCYEMYTRRLPWDVQVGETIDTVLQHINKPPTPLLQLAPGAHPKVVEVLMKGLLPNPDDRWQTIAEMLIPLRKVHEEIEAQREVERQKLAAATKSKSNVKSKVQKDEAQAKKKADDDFFDQLHLGDGTTRAEKNKVPTDGTSEKSSSTKTPPSKSPTSKSASSTSTPNPNQPAKKTDGTKSARTDKSVTAVSKAISNATDDESDIVVEDEFAGIEVEEDEFDGIEIEIEGHKNEQTDDREAHAESMPVPPKPISGSAKKLAALLDDTNDDLEAGIEIETSGADDDEPILRLPDEDDEEIPGIEIEVEGSASRPPKKPGAGK